MGIHAPGLTDVALLVPAFVASALCWFSLGQVVFTFSPEPSWPSLVEPPEVRVLDLSHPPIPHPPSVHSSPLHPTYLPSTPPILPTCPPLCPPVPTHPTRPPLRPTRSPPPAHPSPPPPHPFPPPHFCPPICSTFSPAPHLFPAGSPMVENQEWPGEGGEPVLPCSVTGFQSPQQAP